MGDTALPDDLWLAELFPVVPLASATVPERLGFRGLLTHAHQIAALAFGPAPAEAALMRRLVALTARVTGLDEAAKGPEEWEDRRDQIIDTGHLDPAAIAAYGARFGDRFRLLDPVRPWMQDRRLADECPYPSGLNKLAAGRPAGNNHAWFGHHFDSAPAPLALTDTVASLLIILDYGQPGQCTPREVSGQRAGNTKAGPLRSAMSYFPFGPDLFTTLLASLWCPSPFVRRDNDPCGWETDEVSNPISTPLAVTGPCSTLTRRHQHAVLLASDDGETVTDAYVTWAWRERVPPAPDPYVIRQVSQEGNLYNRRADAQRALWRDLDALLLNEPGGQAQVQRPAVFSTAVNAADGLRIRGLGFDQDPAQAKDDQYVAATTPPILDLIKEEDPQAIVRIGDLRAAGETAGRRLDRAVKSAWREAVGKDHKDVKKYPWADDAAGRYWPAAEDEFWRRLRDQDYTDIQAAFNRLAEAAFDHVTGRADTTMRVSRARARARPLLYRDPLPKTSAKRSRS